MINQFLITDLFAFLLVFFRIGAGIMVLPGFGEGYVSPRIRLLVALGVTLLMVAPLRGTMPPIPDSPLTLLTLIIAETMTGLFIGGISRLLISATHIAGQIMAFQSSLSTANMFDFNQATQGTLLGNMLSVLAVILLFAMDLHHLMLRSLADSYSLFSPGVFPPIEDFANLATTVLSKAFMIALKISSPLIVVGLMMYVGAGILSRLMPAMQVFFILMAPQILLSFFIIMTTMSGIMLWYMGYIEESLRGFMTPGG